MYRYMIVYKEKWKFDAYQKWTLIRSILFYLKDIDKYHELKRTNLFDLWWIQFVSCA